MFDGGSGGSRQRHHVPATETSADPNCAIATGSPQFRASSASPVGRQVEATATILSVDGIGAYDHIHRAAMFGPTLAHARCQDTSFVRLSHEPSQYLWHDEEGVRRTVTPSCHFSFR